MDKTTQNAAYSQIVGRSEYKVVKTTYIELDATNCRDCYEVAKIRNAHIIHAISAQLPLDASLSSSLVLHIIIHQHIFNIKLYF